MVDIEEEQKKPWKWIHAHEICATEIHKIEDKEENNTIRERILEKLSHTDFKDYALAKSISLPFYEECLAMVLLFLFPGCVFWVPALFLYIIIFQCTWYNLLIMLILLLLPHSPRNTNIIHSYIAGLYLRYFSFKVVYSKLPSPDEVHVFGGPPHGLFPIGNVLSMLTMKSLGGFYFKGLAATAALTLPVLKNVVGWVGGVSASADCASQQLKDGHSLGISIGGVAEIFESNSENECLFLLKRKGFIKLALRHGVDVYPCFVFGNTQVLTSIYDPWGIARTISRKLKVAILLMYGRYFLPIMRRVPITVVFGDQIKCPKIENPTQEDIDKYHDLFVKGIVYIFETHKEAYGWGGKKLILK